MSDMGSGEMGTPTKTTKTSTPQEPPPSTTAAMPYPEWAAAFQAYYSSGMSPLPPPGYFPSTVGSGPQPHPYMWATQPLMPPYGTPPPYAAMYPHGGIYAHPSIPPGTPHPYGPYSLAAGNPTDSQGAGTPVGTDAEGKSADGKAKRRSRKSKESLGSLGMLSSKGSDPGKGNSGSMNGGLSHSADSGSEGSTEGSEDDSQNGSQGGHKGSFDQATSEAPSNQLVNPGPYGTSHDANHGTGTHPVAAMPISIGGKQVVGAGPLTNLNIGMDYWSGGTPGVLAAGRSKRGSSNAATSALVPSPNMLGPGREEVWLQDERELKRQRRKQSNRESARRSRLRKQAECEELAARVDKLTKENTALRNELSRIQEECKKLSEENNSLLDQLQIPRSEGLHHGDLEQNTSLSRSDVLEEGIHMDNGSLQRDARDANETLSLTGSSNVDYGGGNLVSSG